MYSERPTAGMPPRKNRSLSNGSAAETGPPADVAPAEFEDSETVLSSTQDEIEPAAAAAAAPGGGRAKRKAAVAAAANAAMNGDGDGDGGDGDDDAVEAEPNANKKRKTKPTAAAAPKSKSKAKTAAAAAAAAAEPAADDSDGDADGDGDDTAAIEAAPAAAAPVPDAKSNGSSSSSSSSRARSGGAFVGEYADSGIITRIQLQNFLCHRNLLVELGKNVNFIHGKNGSGKSAILAGIQFVLGSKASDIGRGSNARALIRDEANDCCVELWLLNGGLNAFKPKEFGPTIQLRRTMTRNSAAKLTAFKDGAWRAIAKPVLTEMCQHFMIQATNPCVVMNQDTSREFLQSKKDEDKYRFFLMATSLQQMKDDMAETTKKLRDTSATIDMKNSSIVLLRENVKAAEHNLKAARKLDSEKDLVSKIVNHLAWDELDKEAKKVEALAAEAETFRRELEKGQQKQTKWKLQMEGNAEDAKRTEALKAEVERFIGLTEATAKKVTDNAKQIAAAEVLKRAAEAYIVGKQNAIKRLEKEIKKANERIEAARASRQTDRSAEEAERQARITEAESALAKLRAQLATEQDLVARIETAQREYDEIAAGIARVERERTNDVSKANANVKRLEERSGNNMRAFGDRSPEVAADIAAAVAAGKFGVEPVGPIGQYIKLRDSLNAVKFCKPIIESFLSSPSKAYIVDSAKDFAVLKQILRKHYPGSWSPIILTKRKPAPTAAAYNIPQNAIDSKADGDIPSVYSFLDIANRWVHDTLVDQTGVESWHILPPSHTVEQATALTRKYSGRVKGFCKDQYRFSIQGTTLVSFSHANDFPKSELFQADIKSELKREREKLAQAQADVKRTEKDKKAHETKSRDFRGELKSAHRQVASTTHKITTAEQDLTEAKRSIAPDEVDDIKAFDAEVVNLKNQIADANAAIEVKRTAIADQSTKTDTLNDEKAKLDLKRKEIDEDHKRATNELTKLLVATDLAKQKYEKVSEQVRAVEAELKKKEGEHATASAEHAKHRAAFGGQPPDASERRAIWGSKSRLQLEGELNAKRRRIDEELKALGGTSTAELLQRFNDATEQVQSIDRGLVQANNNLVEIQFEAKRREKEWEQFRSKISRDSNRLFGMYLMERKAAGSLEFDHANGRLILQSTPEKQAVAGHENTDTKTLSGGERSFTTLAFVLALGDSMNAPFRAMDEFDVFMDHKNRTDSMRILMSAAKRGTQYLFLTPQDISMIAADSKPYVKCIRLKDPDRTQSVLPFRAGGGAAAPPASQ